jgi:hypothetical protein
MTVEMSQRWDWTEEEAVKAFKRAANGKGRQLAKLIKATSEDDLAEALSRYPADLRLVLSHCLGRREQRRDERAWRKTFRQGVKAAEGGPK